MSYVPDLQARLKELLLDHVADRRVRGREATLGGDLKAKWSEILGQGFCRACQCHHFSSSSSVRLGEVANVRLDHSLGELWMFSVEYAKQCQPGKCKAVGTACQNQVARLDR